MPNALSKTWFYLIFFLYCWCLAPQLGYSHPHVFVNAKLDLIIAKDGSLEKLSEKWVFDPVFSAGVLMDFSANKQNLSDKERQKLRDTMYKSMAYFNYFQSIRQNNQLIKTKAPELFQIEFDKLLRLNLQCAPQDKLQFQPHNLYIFRVFDPSFYVHVTFAKDSDISVENLPAFCQMKIIRPDPDKVLLQNAQSLSEDYFTDSQKSLDLALQLAIRLEITC